VNIHRKIPSACLLVCSWLLLAGCAVPPSPTPELTAVQDVVLTAPITRPLPGGLTLEEYLLVGPPTLEPLSFTPAQGSQAEILARHASLRENRLPNRMTTIKGNPAITADWQDGTLLAEAVTPNPETHAMMAELLSGDQLIFSAPAGLPSPANPLQGLWTYDGHWALEVLLATPDVWRGNIYLDGQLLNDLYGYEEAFGSQLLAGKFFYFYLKDGGIGAAYDEGQVDLGYSQVPHYRCCSESIINPQQAEDMVAFFAEREGAWYYVELGRFD
jgi:hypothetical protein